MPPYGILLADSTIVIKEINKYLVDMILINKKKNSGRVGWSTVTTTILWSDLVGRTKLLFR
jgi:hypothetical protein